MKHLGCSNAIIQIVVLQWYHQFSNNAKLLLIRLHEICHGVYIFTFYNQKKQTHIILRVLFLDLMMSLVS